MIEAVSPMGIGSAAGSGLETDLIPDLGHGAPDAATSARFESMMFGDGMRVAEAGAPVTMDGVVDGAITDGWIKPLPGPAEALPQPSISDTFMHTVQSVREDWMSIRTEMADLRGQPDASSTEMLSLMAELAHANVTVSLLMQETSTISSGIGQLMKAQ